LVRLHFVTSSKKLNSSEYLSRVCFLYNNIMANYLCRL